MKQRNLDLVFLRAGLVVPLQQNVVVVEQFDDGADEVAGCGGDTVASFEISHVGERNALQASPKNVAVGL